MRIFKTFLLYLVFMFVTTSCATLANLLPKVIAAATEGGLIIDSIQSHIDHYFAVNPDPDRQAAVHNMLDKTRLALSAALRATQGAKDLSQNDVNAAFVEFSGLYKELLAMVGPMGVKEAKEGTQQPLGAQLDGTLTVPRPLAMVGSQ